MYLNAPLIAVPEPATASVALMLCNDAVRRSMPPRPSPAGIVGRMNPLILGGSLAVAFMFPLAGLTRFSISFRFRLRGW